MRRSFLSHCRSASLMLPVLTLAGGGGVAWAQTATSNLQTWMTNFNALGPGYSAVQGASQNFSCMPYPNNYTTYLGSCFGNNSATPYILVAPPGPPSPQPYALPSYLTQYFAYTEPGTSHSGYSFYKLAANEAIVVIVNLPPKGAYWSYQSYMFERYAANYPVDPIPPEGTGSPPPSQYTCTPGYGWPDPMKGPQSLTYDCNYNVFGYFGNAINDGDVRFQYGIGFNTDWTASNASAIAIVTTANTAVYNALATQFNATPGLVSTQLFLDPVAPLEPPNGGVNGGIFLGNTTSADTLASIIRYTYPQNQIPSDPKSGLNWSVASAANVLVYRVQVPLSVAATGMQETSTLLSQTNNTVEAPSNANQCPAIGSMPMSQSYDCDLQELGTLLKNDLATQPGNPTYVGPLPTVNTALYPTGGSGTNGPGCITKVLACAGGTQDTDGYFRASIGNLLAGIPAFYLGVDHVTTLSDSGITNALNNANYTGVSAAISFINAGASDIIQPNSSSTFSVASVTPAQTNYLLGSGIAVVTTLTNAAAANGALISPSPALIHDAPNLYVAVFRRTGTSVLCPNGSTAFFCAASAPYITVIQGDNIQLPNYIPMGLNVDLTERAYNLPTSVPAMTTGANPTFMQPPYVVYDPTGN